jgi:thymidylate kinase
MPIIILEGIDGAGKSTLAAHILEKSQIRTTLLHRGPLEGTIEDELIYPLQNVASDELLIADRWHLGELVYGPIYRGKSLVEGFYNTLIDQLLFDMNAVKVVLSPPLDVVKERLAIRGEDYLQPEHVEQVHTQYETLANKHDWRLIREVTPDTAAELLALAMEA